MNEEIKDIVGYDTSASADVNVQHLLHFLEGYRAALMEIECNCPYSPGSAAAGSWMQGWNQMDSDQDAVLNGAGC